MMNQNIVVDLQGFKDSKNKFIIKEFALATKEYTQMFLIKPPYAYSTLSPEEKKHVIWIQRNRGIYWKEGFIDVRVFKKIVKPYLENKSIFVKGNEKVKWVKELCPDCNVFDIAEMGCPNLTTLSELYCKNRHPKSNETNDGDVWWDHPSGINNVCYNCVYHKKMCALKNVILLKHWIGDNPTSI